jgi:hypothetical protein
MSQDAVFKGSGFLCVDRERALEKLALFSMERAEDFILAWVRSAVAAGAEELNLLRGQGLELRFDGKPFSDDELADPYAALFSGSPDPRLRHLAVGLLTCLRTNPKSIVIESGPATARQRLEVRSLREEGLSATAGDERRTLMRVRWPLGTGGMRYRASFKRARAALSSVPAGFLIEGETAAPPPPTGPAWHQFSSGSLRGRITLPAPGATGSTLTFCVQGVEVQTVDTWMPWVQSRAWVDGPDLTLNASQSAVVEDDKRRAALDAVAEAGRDLLSAAARGLSAERPEGAASGNDWGRFTELLPWLRDACTRLLKTPGALSELLLEELRAAPVLLDVCSGALSLGALESEFKVHGSVAWSSRPCPDARPPGRVAWAPDEATLDFLVRNFGTAHLHDLLIYA